LLKKLKGSRRDEAALVKFDNVIEQIEETRINYNHGLIAGRAYMQTHVCTRFGDFINDLCGAATEILRSHGVVKECKEERTLHRSGKGHSGSLEMKVGQDAAKLIRQQLAGTAYEWMLDLQQESWPIDSQPPIPLRACHSATTQR
jgi:hypothetical protein